MNTLVENINDLKDTIQINLTALKEFQKQGAYSAYEMSQKCIKNLESAFSMLNYYQKELIKKVTTPVIDTAEKKSAKEILFGGNNNGR